MMPTTCHFIWQANFTCFAGSIFAEKRAWNIKGESEGWRPFTIWNALCGSAPMVEVDDQMISPWHRWSGWFLFPSRVAMRDGQHYPGGQWKGLSLEALPVKKKGTRKTHECVWARGHGLIQQIATAFEKLHFTLSWVKFETNGNTIIKWL